MIITITPGPTETDPSGYVEDAKAIARAVEKVGAARGWKVGLIHVWDELEGAMHSVETYEGEGPPLLKKVADLCVRCSFDTRTDKRRGPAAASDCCQRHAVSAVVTPTGGRYWRCEQHEGQIDQGHTGPIEREAVHE